ncbi:MAG TPA: hypothetical protein VN720_07685 [Rudaea sp.]|nr:hypothetical protein [Rudaea sp.]
MNYFVFPIWKCPEIRRLMRCVAASAVAADGDDQDQPDARA